MEDSSAAKAEAVAPPAAETSPATPPDAVADAAAEATAPVSTPAEDASARMEAVSTPADEATSSTEAEAASDESADWAAMRVAREARARAENFMLAIEAACGWVAGREEVSVESGEERVGYWRAFVCLRR